MGVAPTPSGWRLPFFVHFEHHLSLSFPLAGVADYLLSLRAFEGGLGVPSGVAATWGWQAFFCMRGPFGGYYSGAQWHIPSRLNSFYRPRHGRLSAHWLTLRLSSTLSDFPF